MIDTAIKIGPGDHGRRMKLADFDLAEVQEGYLYELSRGVITVSDVPKLRHANLFTNIRRQFAAYDLSHPGAIHGIFGGSECKLLIDGFESERHPDLAIYKNPPTSEENLWSTWIPDLVIEIVSPGSERRDYEEKREEYLAFGVSEYWIVDAAKPEMLVLQRKGGRRSPRDRQSQPQGGQRTEAPDAGRGRLQWR